LFSNELFSGPLGGILVSGVTDGPNDQIAGRTIVHAGKTLSLPLQFGECPVQAD